MNNQQGNRNRQHGKQEKKLKEVYLPYQFIPFSEDEDGPRYFVPYNREIDEGSDSKGLPRHDCPTGLTGTIEYEIQPELPLALEIRKVWKNDEKDEELLHDYFLSGSQIRGLVRSNAETLSHSVPEFVNKQHLLFRSFNGAGKEYHSKLKSYESIEEKQSDGSNQDENIEVTNNNPNKNELKLSRIVKAGFLIKEGNRFFIIPAPASNSDEYFEMIKEHELLIDYKNNPIPQNFRLFFWKHHELDTLRKRDKEILELTKKLEIYDVDRSKYTTIFRRYSLSLFENKLNGLARKNSEKNVDLSKCKLVVDGIRYNKIIRSNHKYYFLNQIREELKKELINCYSDSKTDDRFFEIYTIRWMLKIERAIYYTELKKNNKYEPYQLKLPKGKYLYNSSHAGKKNSHYLINAPDYKEEKMLEVPDHLINQYNELFSRMKFPSAKSEQEEKYKNFYDIFNKDKGWDKSDKKVVFYLTNATNEIITIGRTPYLKVPVNHSIEDLLNTSDTKSILQNNLDYASAIFGFVTDKNEAYPETSPTAYRSRVRFESVRLIGGEKCKPQKFLLLSPSISSEGMYLKQSLSRDIKQRYINPVDEKPSLRGRKYYIIRKNKVNQTTLPKDNKEKDLSELHSTKYVYCEKNLKFEGKIHFHGLSPDELGLLLLSVDIGLIAEIRNEFEKEFQHIHPIIKSRLYELIGGAKPYGYGKVTMKVKQLQVEPSDISFESLMGWNDTSDRSDYMIKDAIKAFLDKIITEFETDYLQSETFQHYLLSKTEFDTSGIKEFYEWTNLKVDERGNKGGYDTKWILGTRDVHPG